MRAGVTPPLVEPRPKAKGTRPASDHAAPEHRTAIGIDNVVAALLGLNAQLEAQMDPPADIKDMLARWRWLFCSEKMVNDRSEKIWAALAAYEAGGEPWRPHNRVGQGKRKVAWGG